MSTESSAQKARIPNLLRDFLTREDGCHDGVGYVESFRAFNRLESVQQVDFIDFVRVPDQCSIGRHRHGNNTEWYVILSGTGKMLFKEETVQIKPWDVLINPPFHEHGLFNDSGCEIYLAVFQLSDQSNAE